MKKIIMFVVFIFTGVSMAIEKLEYIVVKDEGEFELRHYQPNIVAEVSVSGSLDSASNKGFRLIADYIFGNNQLDGKQKQKIKMTAPVTVEPASEKIDMTDAVMMRTAEGNWQVRFVMPSKYTIETLPKPNNDQVLIKQIAQTRYAVIRFSGLAGEKKIAKKTKSLMSWLEEQNISAKGKPELARYNPPWTLPFMRRNEIMVEY